MGASSPNVRAQQPGCLSAGPASSPTLPGPRRQQCCKPAATGGESSPQSLSTLFNLLPTLSRWEVLHKKWNLGFSRKIRSLATLRWRWAVAACQGTGTPNNHTQLRGG